VSVPMCRVGESVRAAKKWSWARTLSKVKTVLGLGHVVRIVPT